MAAKKTAKKTPAPPKTARKAPAAKAVPPKAAKKTATKAAAPAAGRMTAKVSPLKGMPVEEYLATKVQGWQADVARRLVALVARAAPEVTTVIKWGQPVFELNGPFAYLKPAKAHLTFGFWRGAELPDPKKLLGPGDRMSHLKLTGPEGIDEAALHALVKHAVKMNREKGDPTKR